MLLRKKKFWRLLLVLNIIIIQCIILLRKNLFFLWVCIELNMFIVLGMLRNYTFVKRFNSWLVIIWYFILQVVGRFLLFIGFVKIKFYWLLFLGILLKIGFFPLLYWVVYLYKSIKWLDIFVLGYLRKIGLLRVLKQLLNNSGSIKQSFIVIFLFRYIIRLIGIYYKINNLKLLTGWSSLNKLSIIIFFSFIKNLIALKMLYYYGLVFFFFCLLMNNIKEDKLLNIVKYLKNNHSLIYKILFQRLFLIFVGLPPFIIFLIKVVIMFWICNISSIPLFILFSIIIFIQILIYVKVFKFLRYKMVSNIKFISFVKIKIFLFLVIILLKFILFVY